MFNYDINDDMFHLCNLFECHCSLNTTLMKWDLVLMHMWSTFDFSTLYFRILWLICVHGNIKEFCSYISFQSIRKSLAYDRNVAYCA